MQSNIFKIITILLFFFQPALISAAPKDFQAKLILADSLFAQQKYTQSYELYDSIYTLGKLRSPAMLLKMAYIREGLGDYTMALYYLYDYYIQTSDEFALEKMETLASAQNLIGYDYSDKEYFLSVYHEYYDQIILLLISLSLVFIVGIGYRRFRLHQRPTGNYIVFSVISLVLIYILNFGMGHQEAIVIHQNTYAMDQPSSSADVVDILTLGHKIEISGETDVWYKTEWYDQEVYIKKKNVLPVTAR